MKPKHGQIVNWGSHTDEYGVITRLTRDGFYARYKSIHPSVPGGSKAVYMSRFFTFSEVESGKVKMSGLPCPSCGKTLTPCSDGGHYACPTGHMRHVSEL